MNLAFYYEVDFSDDTSETRSLAKCSYKELIKMLNLHWSEYPEGHLRIRQKALAELIQYHSNPSLAQNPIQAGSEIIIIGESLFNADDLAKRVEPLGIRVTKKMTDSTSHVLLGVNPKTTKGLEEKRITLLSDQNLQNELDRIEKPFLKEQSTEVQNSIEHVGSLLMSNQDENVELAIQIIEGGGFPKELISYAFITMKQTDKKEIRQALKVILSKHLSEAAKESIQRTLLFHKSMDESQLQKNLKKYTQDIADFNPVEIAQIMYKYHKKCSQYLFSFSKDKALIKQIIEHYIKDGDTLDFESLGISKLPKELVEFKQIKRVLLASNKFTMVPSTLAKMANVQFVDLSYNRVKTINATFQEMKNLRHLMLRCPIYKWNELKKLLELQQLEELDLMDYELSDEMMQRLKKNLPNCKITFH